MSEMFDEDGKLNMGFFKPPERKKWLFADAVKHVWNAAVAAFVTAAIAAPIAYFTGVAGKAWRMIAEHPLEGAFTIAAGAVGGIIVGSLASSTVTNRQWKAYVDGIYSLSDARIITPQVADGLTENQKAIVKRLYESPGNAQVDEAMEDDAVFLFLHGAVDNMSLTGEVPTQGHMVQLSPEWRADIKNDRKLRKKLGL